MTQTPVKSAITMDADREALTAAAAMSSLQINAKIDDLVAEHLKLKAMGLHKDAEIKAALAAAYARIWLRR